MYANWQVEVIWIPLLSWAASR